MALMFVRVRDYCSVYRGSPNRNPNLKYTHPS